MFAYSLEFCRLDFVSHFVPHFVEGTNWSGIGGTLFSIENLKVYDKALASGNTERVALLVRRLARCA